jgi:hypothetical protein
VAQVFKPALCGIDEVIERVIVLLRRHAGSQRGTCQTFAQAAKRACAAMTSRHSGG